MMEGKHKENMVEPRPLDLNAIKKHAYLNMDEHKPTIKLDKHKEDKE